MRCLRCAPPPRPSSQARYQGDYMPSELACVAPELFDCIACSCMSVPTSPVRFESIHILALLTCCSGIWAVPLMFHQLLACRAWRRLLWPKRAEHGQHSQAGARQQVCQGPRQLRARVGPDAANPEGQGRARELRQHLAGGAHGTLRCKTCSASPERRQWAEGSGVLRAQRTIDGRVLQMLGHGFFGSRGVRAGGAPPYSTCTREAPQVAPNFKKSPKPLELAVGPRHAVCACRRAHTWGPPLCSCVPK